MWLDFERRVTFLLPIGCLLILIFLLPTPLKVLPPRPAILSWNQLNNSTPVATLKSTMLNSWYLNRFNSQKDAFKGQDNADVLSDSPEMKWLKCQSLAEFSSLARWRQFLNGSTRFKSIHSLETSIPCQHDFQNIDMAAWKKVGKKVKTHVM